MIYAIQNTCLSQDVSYMSIFYKDKMYYIYTKSVLLEKKNGFCKMWNLVAGDNYMSMQTITQCVMGLLRYLHMYKRGTRRFILTTKFLNDLN